ncbi:Putative zinc-finger [Friedmanniella luteola]|uniref:Regulator of SigK n=1 Tax=Friedmanniella luteola TaxID=546871 RepID=A0A1H1SPJ2_9ACTN|nr:anti-sigma factor [Friedmanniella luteola]SDS49783.1 Putative zinc-finger [Friedmanniella luteola]
MSDAHGAVGSYVVHGLTGPERADFERHLTGCPTCQVEVHELLETAAELSRLTSRTPPPALRGRILGSVRRHRPLPPAVTAAVPAAPRTPPAARARPVRQRRLARLRLLAPVLALAVALAVALGGGGAGLVQQHQVQVDRAAQEDRLMTADDVSVHRALLAGGHPVTLVVSKHQDRALLVGAALPPLDPGHSYQLWTQDGGGEMAPGPAFGPTVRERVWLTSGVAGAVAVALSVEPRGGSSRPTGSAEVVAFF